MQNEFSQKIAEARRSAAQQNFHDAETALRYVIQEAERASDPAALAEARGVAVDVAQRAWGSWRQRFNALASQAEAAQSVLPASPRQPEAGAVDSPYQAPPRDLVARWVSACVVLFGVAAALSALGGAIVFFDQVGPDAVAAITGLIVGAVAAALWIGLAVALVLLRHIEAGIRTLTSRA